MRSETEISHRQRGTKWDGTPQSATWLAAIRPHYPWITISAPTNLQMAGTLLRLSAQRASGKFSLTTGASAMSYDEPFERHYDINMSPWLLFQGATAPFFYSLRLRYVLTFTPSDSSTPRTTRFTTAFATALVRVAPVGGTGYHRAVCHPRAEYRRSAVQ